MLIAHQKIVRDRMADEDKYNLFGNYWDAIDKDLSMAIVKPVNYKTAQNIIEKYEWLGCMPAIVWYCYGIFFDGNLGGVVVFGVDYTENLGVWNKFDYTGKIILLSRGACVHWTPKNTASKLITQAIKMLPEKYKIVTATVDHLAGEIGTIYQACNFYYIGCMRENNPKVKGNKVKRDGWLINGKIYGSRSLRSKIGSQKREDILRHFPMAVYMEQKSKDRYFFFRGNRKEQEYYKSKIEQFIKPYPKRTSDG